MKTSFVRLALLVSFVPAILAPGPAHAGLSKEFSVAATAESAAVNGQIDWPEGRLANWKGPVLIFISPGNPIDRDGWLVRALETQWFGRSPLKTLSGELVREGVAVVRFDNPGVMSPARKCRATILKHGVSDKILRERCLDVEVLSRMTVERYVRSVELVLEKTNRMIPNAKKKVTLFGFSEGLLHAVSIVLRHRTEISSLVSIGSPAESPRTLSHWQATDRIIETFPEFDLDKDGIVTNDEIRVGYKKGIGHIASSVDAWLSPMGQWTSGDIISLRAKYERQYSEMLRNLDRPAELEKLNWVKQGNGTWVPDITNSFWNLHLRGEITPAEVIKKHNVPSLFLWGDMDKQAGIGRQEEIVRQSVEAGAPIKTIHFPLRHHLLSRTSDTDWFEPSFAPNIAKYVRVFLDISSKK
jgi:pimeloyl-ACP methyl ester carboxylesterase